MVDENQLPKFPRNAGFYLTTRNLPVTGPRSLLDIWAAFRGLGNWSFLPTGHNPNQHLIGPARNVHGSFRRSAAGRQAEMNGSVIPHCRGVPGGATSRSVSGTWLAAVPLVPSLWDSGSCLQASNCSEEGTVTAAVAAIFGINRTRISSVNRIEVARSYFVSGTQIQASTPGFLVHVWGLQRSKQPL